MFVLGLGLHSMDDRGATALFDFWKKKDKERWKDRKDIKNALPVQMVLPIYYVWPLAGCASFCVQLKVPCSLTTDAGPFTSSSRHWAEFGTDLSRIRARSQPYRTQCPLLCGWLSWFKCNMILFFFFILLFFLFIVLDKFWFLWERQWIELCFNFICKS